MLKSTSFRVAVAFAMAVTITTYVVFALVYWQFYNSNLDLLRSVLQYEVGKTVDMPPDRLRHQLDLRLTQDLRHLDYVGLYDARGTLTFGDVPPGLDIPVDGTAHLIPTPPSPQDARRSENAVFVAARRRDGGKLVLGRSLVYVDQLEAAMLHGFEAATLPVILIAIAAGTIVSLRASRRLTTIQEAINRVMRGELQIRLPARGTPDDIDELVRAVNKMLDEIARLINQLKSVGDNIAHDLRAPLSVMRARLERGLSDPSEANLRQIATDALGDLERAMMTVTALLRISELETSLRRSEFGAVDLADILRQAFELYAPLGESKGLAMTIRADTPTVVTGDGDLLKEALANLIENAIKFTPRGGCVAVECGLHSALVRVADTGPGVAPSERDQVIKRFYRSQATREQPGFGLGLSMTTTIVELHGFGLRISDGAPGAVFDIVSGASHDASETQKSLSEDNQISASLVRTAPV